MLKTVKKQSVLKLLDQKYEFIPVLGPKGN